MRKDRSKKQRKNRTGEVPENGKRQEKRKTKQALNRDKNGTKKRKR